MNSSKYDGKYGGNEQDLCCFLSAEATRIIRQPGYKVVQRNSMAVFECKVKHDPSLFPSMIWLKDNMELPDDTRYDLQPLLQLLFKYKHHLMQGLAPEALCMIQAREIV